MFLNLFAESNKVIVKGDKFTVLSIPQIIKKAKRGYSIWRLAYFTKQILDGEDINMGYKIVLGNFVKENISIEDVAAFSQLAEELKPTLQKLYNSKELKKELIKSFRKEMEYEGYSKEDIDDIIKKDSIEEFFNYEISELDF